MDKEIIMFGDVEIEKKFFAITFLFFFNVDFEKVLVSNKISFGEAN